MRPCAESTTRAMPSMDSSTAPPPSRRVRKPPASASFALLLQRASDIFLPTLNDLGGTSDAAGLLTHGGQKGTSTCVLRNSRAALRRGANREMANSLSCRVVSPDQESCAVKHSPVGSSTILDRSLNTHFTAPSSKMMPRLSLGGPSVGSGVSGASMTRNLVREGTPSSSGRIEGLGGVSRGRSYRSNGGLGTLRRGIGPPAFAGLSSIPPILPPHGPMLGARGSSGSRDSKIRLVSE